MSSAGALSPSAPVPPVLRLGTFVVVDPMVYCGHCQQCRSGWTNLCATGGGLGTTVDGAFARYVTVRSDRCEPVPESVPPEWAPITEPLSCALHALDRAGPVVGADVLVTGAGPAGLLLTRLLSLGGARVDVVERSPLRREAATLFGADRAVASTDELDRELGWQMVVDASGNPAAIQEGLSLGTPRRDLRYLRGGPGRRAGRAFSLRGFQTRAHDRRLPIPSATASGGR